VDEARELLSLFANGLIEKTRYGVSFGKDLWEVDDFHGNNEGLLMAEIEFNGEPEIFEKPEWVGIEVTEDHRYYNSYLSQHPFAFWPNKKPGN
jgi:adenylate cyclase